MTTTPTASPELLDLDHLEALARAATPGPWDLAKIIDRSIEHLCPVDRDRLSLLTVVHEGETPYGAVFRDEDAKFMAGIHPEQVLALIALARRAQQAAAPGAMAIEAAKLAPILRGMCEGGDVHGDGVDIYADGYIAGDGDTYVVRAAALLEQIAATSAPGTPEVPKPTCMTEEQAEKWAWKQIKLDVGTDGWTAGDSCNYFGFFLWGWRYRAQYERQRAAQLDGGQEGSDHASN
jgi:hypothetical protein